MLVLNSLLPIFMLIVAGFVIRWRRWLDEAFWRSLEKLIYFGLTPALLIHALATKPLSGVSWSGISLTTALTLLACAGALVIWQLAFRPFDGSTFTSVFQGGVRYNTFIALAVAEALYGERGLVIGALAAACMIILINVLCVLCFALFVGTGRPSPLKVAGQLVRNPLIIGCVTGLVLNVSGVGAMLPKGAVEFGKLLGQPVLPMALLSVGAALSAQAFDGALRPVVASSAFQFVVKPLLAVAIGRWLGLDPVTLGILVIFLAVPTAPSAYILARQLGGNDRVMATIIFMQTLMGMLTLPVVLFWIGAG